MSVQERTDRPPRSAATVLVTAALAALLLGGLALAADAVPGPLGRLLLLVASTGLAWGFAALALGAWSPAQGAAAVAGAVVMVGAVLTYYGGGAVLGLRPSASSGSLLAAGQVWGAVAVVAGPTLGVLGWQAVRAVGRRRSATWGVVAGLLLSQGVYLLFRNRGSLFEAEAGPLRILLFLAVLIPVLVVVTGARRRFLGTGLGVMALVSVAGAAVWSWVLRSI